MLFFAQYHGFMKSPRYVHGLGVKSSLTLKIVKQTVQEQALKRTCFCQLRRRQAETFLGSTMVKQVKLAKRRQLTQGNDLEDYLRDVYGRIIFRVRAFWWLV